MADIRKILDAEADEAVPEFEDLPADADAPTRDRLAEQLAGSIAEALINYPWLNAPRDRLLLKDERTAAETWLESVAALYNEAQLDVMKRAPELAARQVRCESAGAAKDAHELLTRRECS